MQKCPFEAISIINLPSNLERETTHRYSANSFKLHRYRIVKFSAITQTSFCIKYLIYLCCLYDENNFYHLMVKSYIVIRAFTSIEYCKLSAVFKAKMCKV